jgi:hypothetical protein
MLAYLVEAILIKIPVAESTEVRVLHLIYIEDPFRTLIVR